MTTKIDVDSAKNQKITAALVEREVIYCVSTLVSELQKKADEFPDYTDDLYSAGVGLPDYEEASHEDGKWEKLPDGDERGSFVNADGETSSADDWQELCEEKNIDVSDYEPEVFEHWIVTGWFADQLEKNNQRVLRDFFGLTVWCRCTTGQSISIDSVVQQIAADMEILDGQINEWKV
jgi:hypothetical protein